MKVKKLVYGVGVNNADYVVKKFETVGYTENGKRIQKRVWTCPFYSRWMNMLERCYSKRFHEKCPTYVGCCVVPEWHYFMNFKGWMQEQDWQGKELDKDLIIAGNKFYGPDTCVFVDKKVNMLLVERTASRGEWPIGVHYRKDLDKFQATCWDLLLGKRKHLGYYSNPSVAHQAWLKFKLEQAYILASQQSDPRIAKALIERYENYVAL